MDIRDITKHPFRIECPAELVDEDPVDQWLFSFPNGVKVLCTEEVSDFRTGYWILIAEGPDGWTGKPDPMTDLDSDITNFLDRVARLENP